MTATSELVTDNGVSSAMPRDYFDLLKPRVMSLVVFTALVGMCAAPQTIPPTLAAIALLAIAVGAGASGALNMWYDADIDAKMGRTLSRPVPSGRITRSEALSFGMILAAFSVVTLGLLVNWLAAGLLAFTIFFYAVIYTIWLKRSTPHNIVIGGAAGAFPPVIGWAAMTGTLDLEPWLMFAIIFLWTPPHFWALALFRSSDYERAGIPMMPNVGGNVSTQRQILVYAAATAVAGLMPWLLGYAGAAFAVISVLLGVGLVYRSWAVFIMPASDEAMRPAKRLFAYSIFYLFAMFSALLLDALWGGAA